MDLWKKQQVLGISTCARMNGCSFASTDIPSRSLKRITRAHVQRPPDGVEVEGLLAEQVDVVLEGLGRLLDRGVEGLGVEHGAGLVQGRVQGVDVHPPAVLRRQLETVVPRRALRQAQCHASGPSEHLSPEEVRQVAAVEVTQQPRPATAG
eukprot:CAMPEP_0204199000 /NCGR_PEP_ID=MMETSP0361-20130328/65697_1 /ASSEMBLY_ACC=CAM_ASM_000343 /TAXON_ID=268821 /ORGANISM="Scrippsiella Hangoei, Strain SHTV-5" /LENGTH=150 /DNA_ID=CAMNT_0051161217 /DNA_START=37 /DNA_END=485 /DNA_ORIENTATION=+